MTGVILIYLGSFIIFAWGVAHLFPTRKIIRGFGEISVENRRIIAMEWIIEGITLIFVGILVAVVTFIDRVNPVSQSVYWMVFCLLNILSLISLFTGFRNAFIAFKLCPLIFTGSSLLFLYAGLLS